MTKDTLIDSMTQTDIDRFWSKVDKSGSSGCWGWSGADNGVGYGQLWIKSAMVYAHRIAYQLTHGDLKPDLVVDHRCHNRSCCNPQHLRQVTNKQNVENRAGAQVNSRTGVRGVSWHPHSQTYQARVKHNGKSYSAGYHHSIEEAAVAAASLRKKLFSCSDIGDTKGNL